MAITKSIKEYKITTVGKMKEENIRTNHRYVVVKGSIVGNVLAEDGTESYELQIEICTFKNSSHDILLTNDLFPANSLDFDLGATLPAKSIQSIIATQLKSWMDTNVGVGKWEVIK